MLSLILASSDAVGGGAIGAGSTAAILLYLLNDKNKEAKEERVATRAAQASHDDLVRELLPLIGGVSSVMERTLTVLTSKNMIARQEPDDALALEMRDVRRTLDQLLSTMKPKGPVA